jgi:hypothetical protein
LAGLGDDLSGVASTDDAAVGRVGDRRGSGPPAASAQQQGAEPPTDSSRRSHRSPKRPSFTGRTANARMEAFITHSMLLKLVVWHVWMWGMAMLTMVPPGRIVNRPRKRTAWAAQGLRTGRPADAGAAVVA